jgi:hypothetical protein
MAHSTETRLEGRLEGIEFRSARQEDAEGIAELYKRVYGGSYSLTEYHDPNFVKEVVKKDKHIWHVALNKNTLIGSSVGVPHNWNNSFEIGRTIVKDDFCNKKIAKTLCERVCAEAFGKGFEIGWGVVRNKTMYTIAESLGMRVVGYLPGLHKPAVREMHLFYMRLSPVAKEKRRVPKQPPLLYQTHLIGELTKEMGLENIAGDYPQDMVVGPDSDCKASLKIYHHCNDDSTIIYAIENFDTLAAEYIQATLLTDKTKGMRFFSMLGFKPCAFLPAWFEKDGKRYDCLVMANCGVRAVVPDKSFVDIINKFGMLGDK